jgi:sigma-B regulation protein RsbU (phosphoserine phosphatase)
VTRSKILIVDDEPFNVDYLEQELADLDYETTIAVNGSDALDEVRSDSPDLILLDIMMPVMDGFEVLARLKAAPATRDLPVIVISAADDLNSMVKGISLGAEDYLPKPFEPTLLHARIFSSLEKKRLRDLEQQYLKGLERELEIGREIQTGFLPSELPRVEGWEIAAYFAAAREVAGDFYDAFCLGPEEQICLVIADVCDKGVGAALFMTLFRSLLRFTMGTAELFGVHSPAEKLERAVTLTNDYIANTHGQTTMFATVFIGLLDPKDGKLTYINAGHECPVVVRSSKVCASLKPTGPVIGLFPEQAYGLQYVELLPGDLFFAFTDGAPDALDAAGNNFGAERLFSLLSTDVSAEALLHCIADQLNGHTGIARQYDDVTMLALRRLMN